MIPIQNRSDLAEMFAQPRALLFLWVNWASHARQAQAVVGKAVASWLIEQPEMQVPCYLADVSDQCGDLWDALLEWLTTEERDAVPLMMSGAGPLLWMRSGHVAHHVMPLQYDAVKLVSISSSAFVAEA